MDFKRKKRNVTYSTNSCKMYLRHDFEHRCAYCGVIEESLSPVFEVADKLFEKDHFIPQSQNCPDLDMYSNLFYSCSKCNSKKSNVELSLNPCEDDIFYGTNPHIVGGTPMENFIMKGVTTEGIKFIDDLELNSRYRRKLRENQYQWQVASRERESLLKTLAQNESLSHEEFAAICGALNCRICDGEFETMCGGSDHALDVVDACHFLVEKGYCPKVVLEENEVDISVEINGIRYYGPVLIGTSITERRLKTKILKEQKNANIPFGIFVYIPEQSVMCFYEVDFQLVDWSRKEYRIKQYVQL